MVRTIISLDESDKRWLDSRARAERRTMTQVVREAIRYFRMEAGKAGKGKPGLKDVLKLTKGTWSKGDAVAWVRKMRAE